MSDRKQPVLAEWCRFEAKLPELLSGPQAGRWVLFKDGEVKAACATEREAYTRGIHRYGPRGGQVIARVEELAPVPLSATANLLR